VWGSTTHCRPGSSTSVSTSNDRFLQFGVAAGMMAMADAGLGNHVPAGEEDRWGSYVGAGLGAVQTIDFGG
jgi:3-oxoacyl-(acyl-carrier-protein) synthase